MSIDRIKMLKEKLLGLVETQVNGDISRVDTKELGEVVDMIKDLSETTYYCSITDAMEESGKDEKEKYMSMYAPETMRYYGGNKPYIHEPEYMRDQDVYRGRMYFTEPRRVNMSTPGVNEGSYVSRKMYMKALENGEDKTSRLEKIKKYTHDFTDELTDMLEDASSEEVATLKQMIASYLNKL